MHFRPFGTLCRRFVVPPLVFLTLLSGSLALSSVTPVPVAAKGLGTLTPRIGIASSGNFYPNIGTYSWQPGFNHVMAQTVWGGGGVAWSGEPVETPETTGNGNTTIVCGAYYEVGYEYPGPESYPYQPWTRVNATVVGPSGQPVATDHMEGFAPTSLSANTTYAINKSTEPGTYTCYIEAIEEGMTVASGSGAFPVHLFNFKVPYNHVGWIPGEMLNWPYHEGNLWVRDLGCSHDGTRHFGNLYNSGFGGVLSPPQSLTRQGVSTCIHPPGTPNAICYPTVYYEYISPGNHTGGCEWSQVF